MIWKIWDGFFSSFNMCFLASSGFSTPGLSVARGRVVQRRTRRPPQDGGGEGPQRWCCHHRGGWEGANELIHLLLLMVQKSRTTTWDVKKKTLYILGMISVWFENVYLSIFFLNIVSITMNECWKAACLHFFLRGGGLVKANCNSDPCST